MSERPTTEGAVQPRRHKRRLKNLLLEKGFQLKYSSYLVVIALVLSAALGAVLWDTSRALIEQSQESVRQGELVVQSGQRVLDESEKVNAVVQMNIVKDPEYGGDPALRELFATDAGERNQRLSEQQAVLKRQASALRDHAQALHEGQRTMMLVLILALSLLVVLIGLTGIVVTHKVAGPVHKMKSRLRALGAGDLSPPGRLRKGDQLVEMFSEFDETLERMRRRQQGYVERVDELLATLDADSEMRAKLLELRKELYHPLALSMVPKSE